MPVINFNGQDYDSPDAMPPEVRQLYDMAASMLADSDKNGVPDILEGAATGGAATVSHATQFVVDGKTYTSLDELPPEARRRYEEAMQRFDANADGVPDLIAGMPFLHTNAAPTPAPTTTTPSSHVTMVGEGRRLSAAWIMAIAAIVLLGGAVVFLLVSR